jgi:hypothetical protein
VRSSRSSSRRTHAALRTACARSAASSRNRETGYDAGSASDISALKSIGGNHAR